jgi:hypothetical protein
MHPLSGYDRHIVVEKWPCREAVRLDYAARTGDGENPGTARSDILLTGIIRYPEPDPNKPETIPAAS